MCLICTAKIGKESFFWLWEKVRAVVFLGFFFCSVKSCFPGSKIRSSPAVQKVALYRDTTQNPNMHESGYKMTLQDNFLKFN